MIFEKRLSLSLLFLRIGVFVVMFIWTLDKFVNPEHTAKVFEVFYMIPGLSKSAAYTIGTIQAVVVIAFVVGFKKRISYGLVLLMHTISTVSSYARYFDPWTGPNLLFYAAIPMLAATIALYLLREQDTMLTIDK